LVIAAPWPRLPRSEAAVRALRARGGVQSLPRGRASLETATRHLRGGGLVVVLVDSLNPKRAGRRALPFVDEAVGAPDGLVAWAARQGAALHVAVAGGTEFRLKRLRAGGEAERLPRHETEQLSNIVVEALATQSRERPWEWAWVRALALLTLMCVAGGCGTNEQLPPLPLDASAWRADVTDLRWEGHSQGAALTFESAAARVRVVDGGWVGGFEDVQLAWARDDSPAVTLRGATAFGTFPAGPLTVSSATYAIDGVEGTTDELRWRGGRDLVCGGCPLESLAEELPP
ncbi:MAG: hypothetical protein KDA24_03430, partial [Deltaproteobacteria bacterium]|nr:hypothetical protein [Deltaproteobacteria bacterium]